VWNTQDFLTAYISIPIFFGLWAGWTIYMRSPFWRAHEMDFVTVRFASLLDMPTWLAHSRHERGFTGHPDCRRDRRS
jgi:amino acid permease